MTTNIYGRFAPTPSGRMHLGNVFCALLAWLSARSQKGNFVLRIEDLDQSRCSSLNTSLLEKDLHWLGLDWDKGGSNNNPRSPYCQSNRMEIYTSYFNQLQQKNLIYPCFCSRSDLHVAEAPHLTDGRVVYDGHCAKLTAKEQLAKLQLRQPAYRLKTPSLSIQFTDGLYGPQEHNLKTSCGDFILRRSDGVYAYQLAVVVDDALMGVTEVLRGNDLLASTAQQLYLYQLLGLTPPQFTHLPLLVAPDGRRLSKRDCDLNLGHIRSQQSNPRSLLGKLAYLAGLIDQPSPITATELIPYFNLNKLPKDNIIVDTKFFTTF